MLEKAMNPPVFVCRGCREEMPLDMQVNASKKCIDCCVEESEQLSRDWWEEGAVKGGRILRDDYDGGVE